MLNSTPIGEVRHARFNTVYIINSSPKGESRTGKELHQHLKYLGIATAEDYSTTFAAYMQKSTDAKARFFKAWGKSGSSTTWTWR